MTQRLEAQGGKKDEYKWDDGSDHDDVIKITVGGDSQGIQYIQFDYIKNGQPKYGSFHDYPVQSFTRTVKLGKYKPKSIYLVLMWTVDDFFAV